MDSLVSVIIKNAKRWDLKKSLKEKVLYAFSFMIVFGFVLIVMSSFSIYITGQLCKINQGYAFCNLLLLFNFIILFTKSIFETVNDLYFSRDLRIFLRMPVNIKKMLTGKFLNMILSEYEMELIMLGVPMIVYGIMMHVGYTFYLFMIGVLIVIPIIPIMVTSLLVALVMRFTNLIKNKSVVLYLTVIISSIILAGIFGMFVDENSISISNFTNSLFVVNGLANNISNSFILIKPVMNTMLQYDNILGIQNFIIYIIESLIAYVVSLNVISKIYLKGAIGTTINSNTSSRNIRKKRLYKKDFKVNNVSLSYIIKELKCLVRAPIFCMQCIIMPISYPIIMLMIIFGMVSFANSVGMDLHAILKNKSLENYGIAIYLVCGQVFFMMNFTSIIAISKDEINAKLIKVLPIDLNKQMKLKLFIGKVTNLFGLGVVSYFYYWSTNNVLLTFLLIIALYNINSIGECYKILIDLKKPQLSWDSEYSMMKQNTNVMYEIFYTLLFGLIIGLTSVIRIYNSIYLSLVIIILIIINLIMMNRCKKNKDEIFEKIY